MKLIDIPDLAHKYILARWYYKKGEPFLSDFEYFELEALIKTLNLAPEYLERTWSDDPSPDELLQAYSPILPSLGTSPEDELTLLKEKYNVNDGNEEDKEANTQINVETSPEVDTRINVETGSMETLSSIEEIRHYVKTHPAGWEKYRLSLKEDGWSIQIRYDKGKFQSARSRGRAADSLDLSQVSYILPSTIMMDFPVTIVGELIISYQNFEILKKALGEELASPRSAVRPALTKGYENLLEVRAFSVYWGNQRLEVEEAYSFLKASKIPTPHYYDVDDLESLEEALSILNSEYDSIKEPTDGIVLQNRVDNSCVAIRTGKWENPIYKSYVVGYEDNYGEFDINCGVKIFPVRTSHGKQTSVNCYNLSYIKDFNLIPGAPIAFEFRSRSIAVLAEDLTLNLQRGYFNNYETYRQEVEKKSSYT